MLRYGEEFPIFINLDDGNLFKLQVDAFDSIYSVKAKIKAKTDIYVHWQRLFYRNMELEGGHTLAEYQIQKGSILILKKVIRSLLEFWT